MKKQNILKLVLIALAITSCKAKDSESSSIVESAPVVSADSIDGVWSTDCITENSDSHIESVQVQNGVLTIAKLEYNGSLNCDQANLSLTLMYSGAMTLTGDHVSLVTGKNYNLALNAAVAVPNSAQMVNDLNSMNACNQVWTLQQAGLLFGCIAGNDFDMSLVTYQTPHYGVYTLDSSVTPNILKLQSECQVQGYQGLCPTANDRPSTLDSKIYYRR